MKYLLKKLYNLIPLKKHFFILVKKIFHPSEKIYKHLHFKGVFEVRITKDTSFKIYHTGNIQENEIFWNSLENGWEKKSVSLWIQLSKDAKSILDIGANTGLYALIAQTINPSAIIHTFEPIPAVFSILKKNTELNNFHIKNHELAISDYNGNAQIYMPLASDFAYSVTVNQNMLNKNIATKELTIKTKTLTSFIEENKIDSIDLMKIDVETHEPEVLIGMGVYLKTFRPTMIIEVLDNNIADKLNMILENLGYLYFNINDKNNSIKLVEKIGKSDYWNFLICNEKIAKKLNLI